MAFAQARADAQDPNAPEPPRILHPMLGFTHLPDRALAQVREALDGDETFRARVLERADVSAMSDASRLFLERPEGWQGPLEALVADSVDRAARDDLIEELGELRDRLAEAEAELARQREARLALEGQLEEQRRSESVRQRDLGEARGQISELEAVLGESRSAYEQSVRQLGEAKGLAERRLARIRELESLQGEQQGEQRQGEQRQGEQRQGEQQEGMGRNEVDVREPSPDTVRSLDAAQRALEDLAGTIADLRTELGVHSPSAMPERSAGPEPDPRAGETSRAGLEPPDHGGTTGRGLAESVRGDYTGSARIRRRPPSPGRGLVLDSAAGLTEMLGTPGLLVLVDGYNVSMKGWPNQPIGEQRRSLVAYLGELKARSGADIQVVFDGAYGGQRPAVAAPLPVRVHFTEAEVEADDRLLEYVDSVGSRRQVVVVSSDRRVRDGARGRGAGVVGSETLLALRR
ncbi:MAG: NYN domain-containing protein [Microthrixaceae bacterium]